jgi:acetyl-CoA carboxylase carboxyl transferase subunit beta
MARTGWFLRRTRNDQAMEQVPDGIAIKCQSCSAILFARDFERNLKVCTKCGFHHKLSARERIAITADEGSFQEMDALLTSSDPLHFPEYAEKLHRAQEATGLKEAVVTGSATIEGYPVILGVSDFGFIGGSMGSVVGEKLARAMERGVQEHTPVILFTASGGARMQEGLLALLQMAKTAAAVAQLARAAVPYITVLTDPTIGGVYASYAALGDIILAEPKATVGFAGRRVANQDIAGKLPDNFQTSEFQWEHGMIDRIVPRKELRTRLANLLMFFEESGNANKRS